MVGVDASTAVHRLVDSWSVLLAAQHRLHAVRERSHRNFDGGDAGHQWDHTLVVRHAVNYALGVALSEPSQMAGPVVDVGAGAGGFSVWAAQALARDLVIVDQDVGHRDLAARAFPDVAVRAHADEVEPSAVVLCMEVVEHVPSPEQPLFVAMLGRRVRPGGMLVMSTPDESGFWGGSSGYPPHVATLDGAQLAGLLSNTLPGWDVDVLRVHGPGFGLSTVARFGVPIANRVWWSTHDRWPRPAEQASHLLHRLSRRRRDPAPPTPEDFAVTPALTPVVGSGAVEAARSGTGLVAVARRPPTS